MTNEREAEMLRAVAALENEPDDPDAVWVRPRPPRPPRRVVTVRCDPDGVDVAKVRQALDRAMWIARAS